MFGMLGRGEDPNNPGQVGFLRPHMCMPPPDRERTRRMCKHGERGGLSRNCMFMLLYVVGEGGKKEEMRD